MFIIKGAGNCTYTSNENNISYAPNMQHHILKSFNPYQFVYSSHFQNAIVYATSL